MKKTAAETQGLDGELQSYQTRALAAEARCLELSVAEQEAAQKLGEGLTQEQASVLQEAKERLQQELDSVVEKQVLEVEALGKAHAEALAIVTAQAAVAQQELEVCVEERKASLAGPAKAAQEAKTAAAALEKELEKVQWLVANNEISHV